jgi:hypothetical protein
MQFGGSGSTDGRDSGFCIAITHLATHIACYAAIPVITVLCGSRTERLLGSYLLGTCFETMEDIKSNATTSKLWKISKEAFRRCFQQWQDRRRKCVCAQGYYFEDD